jgi:hypothetical protein
LWKKRSVEEELSELRSYEVWLRSELERVRKEIEERSPLRTGGFYIENVLGERNLNRIIVPVGIAFLVVLFVVAAI